MADRFGYGEVLPEKIAFRRIYLNDPTPGLEEPCEVLSAKISQFEEFFESSKGQKVAIACGSRMFAFFVPLLRELVHVLKREHVEVFIAPAMGSHGGATGEGQEKLLRTFGVFEENIGCPVLSSSDVVHLGATREGYPVYLDKVVSSASGLIVFNRVKSHTMFSGEIESGLQKMLTVGLGNRKGAEEVHYFGEQDGYPQVIRSIAKKVMESVPLCLGVAVIENASGAVADIEVVKGSDFQRIEPLLLQRAKQVAARLPLRSIDLLVLDKIGKDISGTGMDLRMLGRLSGTSPEENPPQIKRIFVRDLSDASHGNANGIGVADVATRKLVNKVDWNVTYRNCLTSYSPEKGKQPLVADSDYEALVWVLKTLPYRLPGRLTILHLRDTSDLSVSELSEGAFGGVDSTLFRVEEGEPHFWSFDRNGNLISAIAMT
jgi:hypothetical protein